MSDKEKIKQEIESYKESMEGLELYSDFRRGQITACNQIMQFIDSLPEETIVKGITWKDVNTLDTLINQVRYEFPNGIGEKSFGLAVLEKFQDYQDVIEEPASEDLEEVAYNYAQQHNELLGFDCDCEPIQTGPEIKKAVIFGAELQKQKDFQDFMEKAERYLRYRVYYNTHPNNINVAIEDFKNYMQDGSK